jgi:hypothetical protein
MDGGYLGVVALFFSVLLILTQRMEEKRKRIGRYFIIGLMILLMLRPNEIHLRGTNLVAYVIAFLVSGLFWVLIGRYNPVGSSDAIKVYGLDD